MLNTINVGLQECSCGLTLNFSNPSGELPRKEEYLLEFTTDSSLPKNSNTVTLDPKSYTINGDNNFVPKVIAKVSSVYRGETQSLIRLDIKDRYNQLLYTDYIRLICSPVATLVVRGTILQDLGLNLGPNGFTLMSVSTTQQLTAGMRVTGPGIDETDGPVYIYAVISENSIELSKVLNVGGAGSFDYTFVRTTSCVDVESSLRQSQTQNLILNKNNNWTYVSNDKFVIKFVRENTLDDDIVIIVPSINKSILMEEIKQDLIPNTSRINVIGRVNNDQYCIT